MPFENIEKGDGGDGFLAALGMTKPGPSRRRGRRPRRPARTRRSGEHRSPPPPAPARRGRRPRRPARTRRSGEHRSPPPPAPAVGTALSRPPPPARTRPYGRVPGPAAHQPISAVGALIKRPVCGANNRLRRQPIQPGIAGRNAVVHRGRVRFASGKSHSCRMPDGCEPSLQTKSAASAVGGGASTPRSHQPVAAVIDRHIHPARGELKIEN